MQTTEVNITSEDQQMINNFSKRYTKLRDINAELKAYADMKEKINDCVEELEMGFDNEDDQVK